MGLGGGFVGFLAALLFYYTKSWWLGGFPPPFFSLSLCFLSFLINNFSYGVHGGVGAWGRGRGREWGVGGVCVICILCTALF